ncbi:uncharacterized protein LOC132796087 [Drosophila nasuta]|uniref:uncharacterized protein LOC132796087 n=1 Tax=Drosophila nasuta TaxID=42062 RepID=UPI00295EE404|nr:uncharacterized protein LOC132796087 [Drosophila nasuta]
MLVNYLKPIDYNVRLDDVDKSFVQFIVIASVIVTLLSLLILLVVHFQPSSINRQQVNECCRRRYANFIFRRLLSQLDDAFKQRPIAGEELICCIQAREQAFSAILMFRRDAAKVLYPEVELDSPAASEVYCVLDEEENELIAKGYASVDVDVTSAFLKGLLYPTSAEPSLSTNRVIL